MNILLVYCIYSPVLSVLMFYLFFVVGGEAGGGGGRRWRPVWTPRTVRALPFRRLLREQILYLNNCLFRLALLLSLNKFSFPLECIPDTARTSLEKGCIKIDFVDFL